MAFDGSLRFDTSVDDSGFKSGLSKLGGVAGSAISGVTKAVGVVSTALTAAGGAAIKVGSEFEAGMSQVAATMGLTKEEIQNGSAEFEKLKAAAKEMGATTQFSATQASEALNYLALAGFDADKSVALLPKSLALAAAGGMELGRATDMITDSMSALGISVKDADGFIDEMARTSQKSNTSVAQLGDAILTVGATAKDLKGGTNELNTALGLLANVGIKGSEGGTKLRNIIMAMTPTTKDATIAFEQLGVQTYDAQGKMRGLNEIMGDMSLAMADMSQEEKTRIMSGIFNKADLAAASGLLAQCTKDISGVSTALQVMGANVPEEQLVGWLKYFDEWVDKADFVETATQSFGLTLEQAEVAYEGLNAVINDGSSTWDALSENIANSKGAAEEMAKVMNDNLKGDITLFQSALEGLGISLYENLGSAPRGAVQMATSAIDELNKAAKGGLGEFVKAVGKVGADILAEIGEMLPQIIDSAVSVIESFLQGIIDNADRIGESATNILTSLVDGITKLLPMIIEAGLKLLLALGEGLAKNADKIAGSAEQMVSKIVDIIVDNLDKIIEVALKIVLALAKALAKNAPKIADSAVKLVGRLVEALVSNLPKIAATALQIAGELTKGLLACIPKIFEIGGHIVAGLVKGIVGAVASVMQAIIKLATDIVKWFKDKLGIRSPSTVMAECGNNVVLGIVKGIKDKAADALNAIGDLATKVKDKVAEKWNNAKEWGAKMADKIKNGISEKSQSVQQSATDLANRGKQAIENAWNSAKTLGDNLVNRIRSGISSGNAAINSAARNLANGAKNAIKNAFNSAKELGRQLAHGIGEGIRSAAQSVYSTVQNFANSVTAKAKNAFGIRSPSRVFRDEVGKNLALGIGEGFETQYGEIARKMAAAVAKNQLEMRSVVSQGRGTTNTTNNESTVNVYLQGRENKEDRRYGENVGEGIAKELRRRGVHAW